MHESRISVCASVVNKITKTTAAPRGTAVANLLQQMGRRCRDRPTRY